MYIVEIIVDSEENKCFSLIFLFLQDVPFGDN